MPARRPRAFLAVFAVVLAWIVIGGIAGPLSAQLTSVQKNDNKSYLPASAEATKALQLQEKFQRQDVYPAIVVYQRGTGITRADRAKAAVDAHGIADLPGVVGPPSPPIPSTDGEALQIVAGIDGRKFENVPGYVQRIRSEVRSDVPGGLDVTVTGIAGLQADFAEVFQSIDTTLLLVTAVVVAIILLLVYRSATLWLVPLVCSGLSYILAQAVVYLLARYAGLTVTGQSQGILTVLVFGAGTDYALLLISRYREELRRHETKYAAMRRAVRGAAPAILASATTVIIAMLCLLISELNSNRSLGPVAAVGIGCAVIVMLSFLPCVLLLFGRGLFWPFVPRYGTAPREERGLWARVARRVGQRPRIVWVATTLGLLILASFVVQLRASGISTNDSFTKRTEAVRGQAVLTRHFPGGSGLPAAIIGDAARTAELVATATATPGVASATPLTEGPPGSPPKTVDGRVQINAVLDVDPGSPKADDIIERLRQRVHAVPDAHALVGGFSAVNLDVQTASQRDRTLIIPLVLVVIFCVLALLLRGLVAPLLLIVTVVVSFAATLGVCSVAFNHVFHFAGADSSFPLFAFVFLVALGIDYNIFLMTRVREESAQHGTREGVLKGLAVTGGVITSAGVVLAATFSVLAVLPLVFLTEIGFAVAFGVLLDTLLVRSLLVPALAYDIGPRIWWPGRLAAVHGGGVEPHHEAVALR